MDRLPALILLLAACSGSEPTPPPERPGRVDAVAAAPKKEVTVADFCEAQPNTPFQFPELTTAAPAVERFTWVNVWATWCAPCLEEMPMLGKWRDAFQREGTPFDLELWSVDEDEAKLRERVQQGLPAPVTWVESPEALSAYLGKIGLDPDAMLPVQMLVDPKDQLRCVRIGSVHENDWGTVRKLIR